jgi:hypothetical protein
LSRPRSANSTNQPGPTTARNVAPIATLSLCLIFSARAAVAFTDNFDSGASPLWGNESGAWSASAGVYDSTQPNNFPNSFSSLPFNLTNFTVDVDIKGVSDGGIWLRGTANPGTAVGVKGVLLVLKHDDFGAGVNGYWHIVTDRTTYGDVLNLVADAATNLITTLNTSAFSGGRVALYDILRRNLR